MNARASGLLCTMAIVFSLSGWMAGCGGDGADNSYWGTDLQAKRDANISSDQDSGGRLDDASMLQPDQASVSDTLQDGSGLVDSSGHEGGKEPNDGGSTDGSDEPIDPNKLVDVSHKRELRGTWIATVHRINWPKASTEAQQKAEMDALLNAAKNTGINAIFFHVRPEADALYESLLEPWSRFLTGTQGISPGYDPLKYVIDECHKRGMELHAWLNPYRAKSSSSFSAATNHVTHTIPEAIVYYDKFAWLDPGHPKAMNHTISVIKDLLTRYDVDGIHFDDYFYPYPKNGVEFKDDATYAAYGGGMSLGDWRRDNVNRMVKAVADAVKELRSDVRWGISPFGIYRPGEPSGVVGLDQYASLYADPMKWMTEGWLDYIAPQLYWRTTSARQPYKKLLAWWDEKANQTGRMLVPGNAATENFGLAEYHEQMSAVRDPQRTAAKGEIWWSIDPIKSDTDGLAKMVKDEFYAAPAATPPLTDAGDFRPEPPELQINKAKVSVSTPPKGLRYWAVYQKDAQQWKISQLVPVQNKGFFLSEGTWAVSLIDRSGRESRGVVVQSKGEPAGASCIHSYGGKFVDKGCTHGYQCCDGKWKSKGFCGACACEESTGKVGCGIECIEGRSLQSRTIKPCLSCCVL